jgi:hypothetical protein
MTPEPVPDKNHDPAEDGQSMAKQVGQAFNYWVWPKKPLSPFPKDGAGATRPQFAKASRPGQRQASTRITRTAPGKSKSKKRIGSVNNFE